MARPKPKTERLHESHQQTVDIKVDREAGIIRGVKILGRKSANGREYSDRALREAASFYEGVGVNLNHHRDANRSDRPVQDGFGELANIRVEPDGVYGDLPYIKSHPMAESIAESAERFPKLIGLSHDATGKVEKRGGKWVVESVQEVHSVDLVRHPATNKSLYESAEEPLVKTKTIRQIVESVSKKTAGAALLREQMDEVIAGEPVADMAVEVPPESKPEDEVKAAFRAMVMAAFDDDSLDANATIARIKEILKAQEKLTETPASAGSGGEETTSSEEATVESKQAKPPENPELKQLKESVAKLEAERDQALAENAARRLLESADREATELRVKAVMALPEKSMRQELIESWPKREQPLEPGLPRPHRSVPLVESSDRADKLPETVEEFAAAL